jgi:transposase IS66-like protein
LNSIDPLAWFTDVLQRIVSGQTRNQGLHALLPWNWHSPSTAVTAQIVTTAAYFAAWLSRQCAEPDHGAPDEHRTARSTAVNNSPSTPDTTRTAVPASLISITADDAVGTATFAGDAASATTGTNCGNEHGASSVLDPDMSSRACRRHPNTCGQICHTRAPGSNVSATIRAFSSADQRRRRPGPVRTSMRRKPPFVSSLTSTITIAGAPRFEPNQHTGRRTAAAQRLHCGSSCPRNNYLLERPRTPAARLAG